MEILSALVCLAMLAGWTAAWLNWCFNGDVINWLVAVMPAKWLAGEKPTTIASMPKDELQLFIIAGSNLPAFLRGVLTCPICLSAHIAGAGTIPLLLFLDPWFLAPIVWAAGSWVGLRAFLHFES